MLAILAIGSIVSVIGLLSSQHRTRLIFGSYTLLDSAQEANWSPKEGESDRRFEPISSAHSDITLSSHTLAASLLHDFRVAHPTRIYWSMPGVDDPAVCLDSMRAGMPLHCYNVDIAASHLLAGSGIYSRMWDLNGGNELGGFGHNVIEVWDATLHSWKLIDPYYSCYFVRPGDSSVLGLAELRSMLQTGSVKPIVMKYFHPDPERVDSEIISEYRFLSSSAMLHANNDFAWRYSHRYGSLMPLASRFDKLSLRTSRGIRTVMLGSDDAKYVINDKWSPHYPIVLLKSIFRGLLGLFFASLIGALYLTMSLRRMRIIARDLAVAQLSSDGESVVAPSRFRAIA